MMYTLDQEAAVKVEMSHFHLAQQLRLCKVYVVQFPKQKSLHHMTSATPFIKYNYIPLC